MQRDYCGISWKTESAHEQKLDVGSLPFFLPGGPVSSELKDGVMLLYVDHLEQLNYVMAARFRDMLDIPGWILDSSAVNAADVNVTLQELLAELQSDIDAHAIVIREKHI